MDVISGSHLAQMVQSTVLVTAPHQGNVPDGLEVCPLPAVARHAAQVLGAVLVLKTPLQLSLTEADSHTEANIIIIKLIEMTMSTSHLTDLLS